MGAAAIPLVAGAVIGGIQGNEERKATERYNKGAAEANRYADVTGHRIAQRQDSSGGMFGGALKGASAFGGLAGAMGGAKPQAPGGSDFSGGGLGANFGSAPGQQRPGSVFGSLA